MKVIIADITSRKNNGRRAGHYVALANNYLNLFGDECVIAGGPVYEDYFNHDNLLKLPYSPESGDRWDRIKTFQNARCLFKQAKGNIIILQHCSTIMTFLCVALFYHKDSKLFLIQYSLEGFRMKLGKWLYWMAKRKITGIICPNTKVGDAYGLPYCVVPDYILPNGALNKSVLLPYDDKIYDMCIIGRIAPGKGVIEAAEYLANTQYKVLIAGGPKSEEIKTKLLAVCNNAYNIDLKLGFVSNEDYGKYLRQSRFALLNYQDEYSKRSSGVVLDMIFAGLPVIGRHCSALNFIEEERMGFLYNHIKDLDGLDICNRNDYNKYMDNISIYCQKHVKYKQNLRKFLFGGH